jgi:hypothetical protein
MGSERLNKLIFPRPLSTIVNRILSVCYAQRSLQTGKIAPCVGQPRMPNLQFRLPLGSIKVVQLCCGPRASSPPRRSTETDCLGAFDVVVLGPLARFARILGAAFLKSILEELSPAWGLLGRVKIIAGVSGVRSRPDWSAQSGEVSFSRPISRRTFVRNIMTRSLAGQTIKRKFSF